MKDFLLIWFCCFAFTTIQSSDDSREVVPPQYLDWLLQEKNYEEFNRLMGINIPHLSRPRTGNETHDPRFSPYLEHGDILLTPKQKEEARQGTSNSNLKWKVYVPYFISDNFTQSQKDIISKGIMQFNKHGGGCISCKPYTNEKDYVFIFPGDGCYSNLGRTGGQQGLSLYPYGCLSMATIVHELMHAIGLHHEHCRSDRDSYITMKWNNIKREWQSQFTKLSSKNMISYGNYECYSVMHYPVSHPDVSDNKPCFEISDSSINKTIVGYGKDATATDVAKIRSMYC